MATGMERLASIDRIQDYFVSNDNLQRNAASDKFAHWESSSCSLFFFHNGSDGRKSPFCSLERCQSEYSTRILFGSEFSSPNPVTEAKPLRYWTQSLAEEADWDLVQDKWWLIDKFTVFRCKYIPGLNPRAHWSLWPPGFRKILHPSDSDFAKEGIKMAMHLNISHEQEHVTSLLPHSSYPKWWRILILSWQHWKPRC